MSLAATASAAYQSNLRRIGDDLVLTDQEGHRVETKGFIRRINSRINPQTNAPNLEPEIIITIPNDALEGLVLTEEWEVSFDDHTGNSVSARVMSPRPDHTLAFITFDAEVFYG